MNAIIYMFIFMTNDMNNGFKVLFFFLTFDLITNNEKIIIFIIVYNVMYY